MEGERESKTASVVYISCSDTITTQILNLSQLSGLVNMWNCTKDHGFRAVWDFDSVKQVLMVPGQF
jgi:hypothetical protein